MSNCTSIFTSLMINEVEKLFHMIIGHWIPCFLKSLFKSISHFLPSSLFLIGLQAFLRHPGYRPLVRPVYADIFFLFMRCLFTQFWWKEILNIDIVKFIKFLWLVFWVILKKLCPTPKSEKCPHVISSKSLTVYLLYLDLQSTWNWCEVRRASEEEGGSGMNSREGKYRDRQRSDQVASVWGWRVEPASWG